MGFGISELLIILAIVGLLFGTKKLRNIGGDLGNAIKSFRGAMNDNEPEQDHSMHTDPLSNNTIEGEVQSADDHAPKKDNS